MLNLKNDELIKPSRNQLGDQGFINELYLWERLDLGLQHNTIVHLLEVNRRNSLYLRISISFLYFRIKPTMNTQRISALSFIILPEKNLNRRVRQSRISGILAISTTNIQRNYILTQIKVRTAKFLLEFYCISTISLLTVSY